MSIIRTLTRLALTQALRGRTLVGNNVFDSRIGALEVRDGSVYLAEEKPFIAIYTDSAVVAREMTARQLHLNGATEIILEWGVTAAMYGVDPKTGESVIDGIGIPATDDAFEFQLDLIGRQISDALSDGTNRWAEIFRKLTYGLDKIERARASSAEAGVRLAGQQLKITAQLIDEPLGSDPIPEPLPEIFSLAKELDDQPLDAKIALIEQLLTRSANPLELAAKYLGATRSEIKALGLARQRRKLGSAGSKVAQKVK